MESIFSKREYKFHLRLKKGLKMPLYKDRNFNLFVGLFDCNNNPILNSKVPPYADNSIPLKIEVYSTDSKPQLLEFNKQGNPILKGSKVVDLLQGQCSFSKMSIREVSSKFERGLVTIVVSVAAPQPTSCNDSDIDWQQVRPLLVKDVLIRAKRIISQCE